METHEKSATKQIVHTPPQGLAVRSAALVVRGLRDLTRDSNWLIKKVFTGQSSHMAISPAGQVCTLSPQVRYGSQRVVLYDIELSAAMMALSVPGETGTFQPGSADEEAAAFAWSPSARYLVAAWGAWHPQLHLFDVHGKMLLGAFGAFDRIPQNLTWSETGKYFAAASSGGKGARLRVWQATRQEMPLSKTSAAEIGAPQGIEPQTYGEGFEEEGAFRGYGKSAFSPNENMIASVASIQGEWADDSILIAESHTLQNQSLFQAQGHITDLTWTPDSRQIVYCAAGQAYRLAAGSPDFEPLPFGAELCVCHPHLPLCVCFSSWLKNSAKGRLFLVDLNRMTVFDEYAAEGVVDLRWSLDGSKAFAMTQSGMAYIYEPALL
jgi:Tol biopolymer transport system component